MAAVRIFAHRGVAPMKKLHETQFAADSVYQLIQPYEWSQKLTLAGATPVTSAPVADVNSGAAVNLLRVEVPDGTTVRYEIGSSSATIRTPGDTSPILSGFNQFEFKSGWLISFVDAASFP